MVVCFLNPLMRYNYEIHTLKTIKCGRSICIIQKHTSVRFYVRILRDLVRKFALHDQFDAQKNPILMFIISSKLQLLKIIERKYRICYLYYAFLFI